MAQQNCCCPCLIHGQACWKPPEIDNFWEYNAGTWEAVVEGECFYTIPKHIKDGEIVDGVLIPSGSSLHTTGNGDITLKKKKPIFDASTFLDIIFYMESLGSSVSVVIVRKEDGSGKGFRVYLSEYCTVEGFTRACWAAKWGSVSAAGEWTDEKEDEWVAYPYNTDWGGGKLLRFECQVLEKTVRAAGLDPTGARHWNFKDEDWREEGSRIGLLCTGGCGLISVDWELHKETQDECPNYIPCVFCDGTTEDLAHYPKKIHVKIDYDEVPLPPENPSSLFNPVVYKIPAWPSLEFDLEWNPISHSWVRIYPLCPGYNWWTLYRHVKWPYPDECPTTTAPGYFYEDRDSALPSIPINFGFGYLEYLMRFIVDCVGNLSTSAMVHTEFEGYAANGLYEPTFCSKDPFMLVYEDISWWGYAIYVNYQKWVVNCPIVTGSGFAPLQQTITITPASAT